MVLISASLLACCAVRLLAQALRALVEWGGRRGFVATRARSRRARGTRRRHRGADWASPSATTPRRWSPDGPDLLLSIVGSRWVFDRMDRVLWLGRARIIDSSSPTVVACSVTARSGVRAPRQLEDGSGVDIEHPRSALTRRANVAARRCEGQTPAEDDGPRHPLPPRRVLEGAVYADAALRTRRGYR